MIIPYTSSTTQIFHPITSNTLPEIKEANAPSSPHKHQPALPPPIRRIPPHPLPTPPPPPFPPPPTDQTHGQRLIQPDPARRELVRDPRPRQPAPRHHDRHIARATQPPRQRLAVALAPQPRAPGPLRDDADGLRGEECEAAAPRPGVGRAGDGAAGARVQDAAASEGDGDADGGACGGFPPAARQAQDGGAGVFTGGLEAVAEELVPPAGPEAGEAVGGDGGEGAELWGVEPGGGVRAEDGGAEGAGEEEGPEEEDVEEGGVDENEGDDDARGARVGERGRGAGAGGREEVGVVGGEVFERVEG